MKIVFMGTPEFAVPSLERIIQDGHEVVAVFTQPDKPQGRGYKLTAPPVKVTAQQHGIEVYQPEKLKDGTALAILQGLCPDVIVVAAYGRILPKAILEVPPLGCINVHGSLLPKYRGAAPIQWSVINGDADAGVTTMYMAEGLDTGDMILKMSTPIGENETSGELYPRLADIGAECLSETLKLTSEGKAPREPQAEEAATLAPMLRKEMGSVDFAKPAKELHNLARGLSPWPGAYTYLDGELLKIHRTLVRSEQGEHGTLLDCKGMVVACSEGSLELVEVQLPGAKRISGEQLLMGKRIKKGTKLF